MNTKMRRKTKTEIKFTEANTQWKLKCKLQTNEWVNNMQKKKNAINWPSKVKRNVVKCADDSDSFRLVGCSSSIFVEHKYSLKIKTGFFIVDGAHTISACCANNNDLFNWISVVVGVGILQWIGFLSIYHLLLLTYTGRFNSNTNIESMCGKIDAKKFAHNFLWAKSERAHEHFHTSPTNCQIYFGLTNWRSFCAFV